MTLQFDNSYARLPSQMFSTERPIAPSAPQGLIFNDDLARDIGIDQPDDWAAIFSGATLLDGGAYIAQAYAGHQFGNWAGPLGDGRAILIGETVHHGQRYDIQLKGAGPTQWSRRGDGLAWYGPALREYLVSEAMHHLGIPTTRALAVVATGDSVYREQGALPGAVLTRIASSHIRVGTFQYFAAAQDHDALQTLFQHTVARHYPTATTPADFLRAVCRAQAKLVAHWMGVGFIHGVMNTDNAHVGGLTIDYGPCAFMDDFHPTKVFSAIDVNGRYAFGNQPQMAAWNIAQLATSLLPLEANRDQAIDDFTSIVHEFSPLFEDAYQQVYAQKLGLTGGDDTQDIIDTFLHMMAAVGADYTNTFRSLATRTVDQHIGSAPGFSDWFKTWNAIADTTNLNRVNPAIIPRNHLIEQMINNAVSGDMTIFHDLNTALKTPFQTPTNSEFSKPPTAENIVRRTFCGT